MIDKKELVNYLMNWKASLGKTFQDDVISIVLDIILKKVESFDCEQNQKWIPVEDGMRIPKKDEYVLMSFENFTLPAIGRYEEDDNEGSWFLGDEDEPVNQYDVFVNAWMELPERYASEE